MYKIIGGDQKEYGPATAEELKRWISEGRLNAQSLILREGDSEWRPLGTFPEFGEALGAQAAHSGFATAISPAVSPEVWRSQILAAPSRLRFGHCLGSSWNLLTNNFGLLFGGTCLVWVLLVSLQFAPLIGPIAHWLLKGVLFGGLYVLFLKRIRGQPAKVGDAFAGFNLGFGQLLLAGAITSLGIVLGLFCCLMLPGIYLYIAWIFSIPLVADKRLEFWSAMELSRKVVSRVWFEVLALVFVAFLPFILFYLFVELRLILEMVPMMQEIIRVVQSGGEPDMKRLVPEAMQIVKDNLVLILSTKLVFLLNFPFAAGALMYAYEDLFGTRNAPPS
jgi:hypothetical protein